MNIPNTNPATCNHDWVYKPSGLPLENNNTVPETRQKRICRNCFMMQRQGINEREEYFNSYFAAPPWEVKSAAELIKEWDARY